MTADVAAEVERFLALERARGLTAKTVRDYERALSELLALALARGKSDDLRELDTDDVVAYLLELAGRGREEATIRSRLYKLKRLFAYLQRTGWLLVDPAAGIKRRYVPESMRAWLSEDEAERLLQAPRPARRREEIRNRAIVEVLYSTGLRLGELLSLELHDLDLAEGYVTVRQSKNGDGRVVPLGQEAVQWVRRYLREVRPRHVERVRDRDRRECAAVVFLSTVGRRLRWNQVNGPIKRYAERAGIDKNVSAHVLRHSFAMHLLRNGASTRHIQAMLGHRDLLATQRYTRLLQLELRDVHRRAHPRGSWPL